MKIVKNGTLQIPLYHGTTSLFIDSIKQNSLGGVDPLIDLRAKELMQELFEIADKQGWDDEFWLDPRQKLKPLIDQEKNVVFNFRHGGTYLTYHNKLAKRYAMENPYGCEYLNYIYVLLRILSLKGVDERKKFLSHPILKLWNKPQDPYIIKVENIRLSDLEPEIEQDLEELLMSIEVNLNCGLLGPESFKLINPISVEKLEILKIGKWNYDGSNLKLEYV